MLNCDSPQFNNCDAWMAQSVLVAKDGVIAMVAGDWLDNCPPYRVSWLHNLFAKGYEIRKLGNLPLCRYGVRRCQWIVIFKKGRLHKYTCKEAWKKLVGRGKVTV